MTNALTGKCSIISIIEIIKCHLSGVSSRHPEQRTSRATKTLTVDSSAGKWAIFPVLQASCDVVGSVHCGLHMNNLFQDNWFNSLNYKGSRHLVHQGTGSHNSNLTVSRRINQNTFIASSRRVNWSRLGDSNLTMNSSLVVNRFTMNSSLVANRFTMNSSLVANRFTIHKLDRFFVNSHLAIGQNRFVVNSNLPSYQRLTVSHHVGFIRKSLLSKPVVLQNIMNRIITIIIHHGLHGGSPLEDLVETLIPVGVCSSLHNQYC